MKKIVVITAFLISFVSFSQETEVIDFRKNEVKINMFYFILGVTEFSYERNLNEETSLGISFLIPTSDEAREDINYAVTPYYRMFFGKKPAQGFFLEAFGMLNSTKENTYRYWHEPFYGTNVIESTNRTDFALGMSLGGKWVLREKIVAEISGGAGRQLFQSNEYIFTSVVPRFNISFGYRF